MTYEQKRAALQGHILGQVRVLLTGPELRRNAKHLRRGWQWDNVRKGYVGILYRDSPRVIWQEDGINLTVLEEG